MKELKTIKAVYSYYFPEIRNIVDEIVKNYPHKVFLQSIDPGLDDFEKPIIKKLIKFYENDVKGLSDFGYSYPTSGASEAIFHTLFYLKNNYPDLPIYSLEGDYEGYIECGSSLGIKVTEVKDSMKEIEKLSAGFWFISNPSSRNGNIIDNEFINRLCNLGHKIILDLSYLGLTKQYLFDVSNPNIFAVITSMSKPFGLFYYRVGFVFYREEIKSLYSTKWFKNILSLIIVDKVFSKFNSMYFYDKYSKLQPLILNKIKEDTGITLNASDVPLLAYITKEEFQKLNEEQKSLVEKFKRKNYYRFCLTRYFLEMEHAKN